MSAGFNRIAVLGTGSWATALVKILSEQEQVSVYWWVRNAEYKTHIDTFYHNPRYLSSVQLDPKKVIPCISLQETVDAADLIVIAIP